jgi:diacylglycerol kinase (ATP)
MDKSKKFSIGKRLASFKYAISGIVQLVKQEHNTRLHLGATIGAIIASIGQGITAMEWIAISIAIGLVWMAEAFNTAIEMFCDLATEGKWHPVVKKIKDISAGAVLIAALVSVVVAYWVFFY